MVLLELLVLKLTLAGILQHGKEVVYEHNLHEKRRYIKSQLSQIMIDYKTGVIDQDTYKEREYKVLSELSEMTGKYDVGTPS
jgi:hypothetical protein